MSSNLTSLLGLFALLAFLARNGGTSTSSIHFVTLCGSTRRVLRWIARSFLRLRRRLRRLETDQQDMRLTIDALLLEIRSLRSRLEAVEDRPFGDYHHHDYSVQCNHACGPTQTRWIIVLLCALLGMLLGGVASYLFDPSGALVGTTPVRYIVGDFVDNWKFIAVWAGAGAIIGAFLGLIPARRTPRGQA